MIKRLYETIIQQHFKRFSQMLFLAGPRQAGKTTIARNSCPQADYLSWDIDTDRQRILKGVKSLGQSLQKPSTLTDADPKQLPTVIFDEIHKFANWKNFLKGFSDSHKTHIHSLVTGSSKLDIYQKGSDSLMGRYFLYRVHPLSVSECLRTDLPKNHIQAPKKIATKTYEHLFAFGGFPEPFLNQDRQFLHHWQRLRHQQLFHEDIRAFNQIQLLPKLELLAEYIKQNATQQVNLSQLANKINVAATTVERWIGVLQQFYYCFSLKPWSKNITRSLLKEPKIFLWDWAGIADEGAKFENFIALHLLKSTQLWTDLGFGEFGLYYLRDKDKNEVDFCITLNQQPWCLIEAKQSNKNSLNKSLYHFQKQTQAPHAFQVVFDADFVNANCFDEQKPTIVPAKTLLSQLL